MSATGRCSPTGKTTYSRAEARRRASAGRRRSGEIVTEYHCRDCNGWHYGSVDGFTAKSRRRP